jgi:hypothetical protein
MKVNKIAILMGVAGLVYGTSSNAFYNVDASLTAPASYHLNYQYDSSNGTYLLGTTALNTYPTGLITYNRTVDGAYYNYSRLVDNSLFSIVPSGLSITMTYNRSNTSWAGGFAGSRYIPTGTAIGSDSTVGNTAIKYILEFNNQTTKDFLLYLDLSSSSNTQYADYFINTYNNIVPVMVKASLIQLFIPSYSNVKIQYKVSYSGSIATYVDGWYLKDLGVSSSYDEGYDDGENAVIASGGLQGIIEGVFEGIVAIFGIEIFSGVSLGAVALFPLVITLFVFVMKIVKMGG